MSILLRVESGSGEHHAIAGADWTWKVRSAQTGGGLCFFEMNVEPGQGVPLHVHTYSEAFYIIEGTVEFHTGIVDAEVLSCGPGDVVLARPEVRHAFVNRSKARVRLLSISTPAHEPFFDAVVAADRDASFAGLPPDQVFTRVVAIGAQTGCRFLVE